MIQLLLFTIIWQSIKVDKFILDNGLTLLVYEDHFAPVVSAQIHYRVGAFDEPKGLTGISHLLEHMVFKGTKRYGPKVYDRAIHEAGGEENGFTSNHVTAFFANLHKDRYVIELEFEADRMINLLLDPKEFEPEKRVVMEERRLNDNDPYGSFGELQDLLTYTYSPYRNPVVGFMSDLERIRLEDVRAWYRRYYNPANAIVVVAGDVRAADVRLMVNKLFGKLKGAPVPKEKFTEPPQQGERRFEYRKDVRMPAVGIQYHTVTVNEPDAYVLNLIAMILSQGRSSRFQREVVRDKNLSVNIYAYSSTAKYAGTFYVFGMPQTGVEVKTLETEIEDQLERLKTEKVGAEELDKAKRLVMAQTIYRQDSPTGIGFTIANWENTTGDWQNINRFPDEIQKVAADDIIRVAQKYFVRDNRTVGYLLPSGTSEEK